MATIRTRKRGKTWSYSFEIGKNPETGRRKMKEKGGFASQDEAYDAGVEAYADWKHGNIGITSSKVLLDNFFQGWLENVVKPNVKRGTYLQYASRYRSCIKPRMAGICLQDIKPRDIDALVRSMAADGKSHETIAGTLSILKSMFRYAVYPAEMIATNPAACISIPRSAPKAVLQRRIISPEEFAEIAKLLSEKERTRYLLTPIMLGYYAGLRIGEALGLCWTDIDFEKKKIRIVRQLRPGRLRSESFFAPPKTATSMRTICMSDKLLAYLRDWRKEQAAERLRFGAAYQITYAQGDERTLLVLPAADKPKNVHEMPIVCTCKFGLPITREKIMYSLRKVNLNFHSLRHTHATRLIEAGAKPVDVAARLGHADVSITENLYSHDTEKMARETAELVDKVM